jgi:Caspase domain
MGLVLRSSFWVLAFVVCLLIPRETFGQSNNCVPTRERPVRVCFKQEALTVDHCAKEVRFHFRVERLKLDNGETPPYYFKWQLIRDRDAPTELIDPFNGAYELLDADSYEDYVNRVHAPLGNGGRIKLKITAFVNSREPVTETSDEYVLFDPQVIRGVIVGVSNYRNSSINGLLYADRDAKSFDAFLHAMFRADVQTRLLTSDSPDKRNESDLTNITQSLTLAAADPMLCTDQDWFIFYFSGHGIVGSSNKNNRGAQSTVTHYLSTVLLNPKDLQNSALPIENVLGDIRGIPAANKLVIFDSCFSGSSTRSAQLTLSNEKLPISSTTSPRSAKIAYVANDELRSTYQIDSASAGKMSGDLLSFRDVPARERVDQRHVLYLAAALANQEAEEGHEKYTPEGKLNFIPADPAKDEQGSEGHGLYTYVLLWNLLSQLPERSTVPKVLDDDVPNPKSHHGCRIDFLDAHTDGGSDIHKLALDSATRLYQRPEVAGLSGLELPPIPCYITPASTDLDVPQN